MNGQPARGSDEHHRQVIEQIVDERVAYAMLLRCVLQGCLYRTAAESAVCQFCGAPRPEPPRGVSSAPRLREAIADV